MEDLTARQIEILKAIIGEFNETGEAVGSEILEKKYKLGVSPATIRNEMVELARKNYLEKEHFSAGRVPSAKGFRFYISHIMKERTMSTIDEVAYKNSVWDARAQEERLLLHATRALAERTGMLALSTNENGDIYYSGIGNLLNRITFDDWVIPKHLFTLIDEVNFWAEIMTPHFGLESPADVIYFLGAEDFRDKAFGDFASVFDDFKTEKGKGVIGVLGPKFMAYDIVTPQVRYVSKLISEICQAEGL